MTNQRAQILVLCISAVFTLSSCAGSVSRSQPTNNPSVANQALSTTAYVPGKLINVKLQTNLGDIVIRLDEGMAPRTVNNFIRYVQDNQYDGTIFHRVIKGFMAQGGGFTQDWQQKTTKAPILNEADNKVSNRRGTVAAARTSDPSSATSQFFINLVDNPFLDYKSPTQQGWGYAVFGEVISGMDVVDKMATIQTGRGGPMPVDVPQSPIIIEKAFIVDAPQAKSDTQLTPIPSSIQPTPTKANSTDALGLSKSKNDCKELGYKVGTKDFGNCVMNLMK